MQAGLYYCITDYETTTTQRDTYAVGHRFNILVQAVTNYKLSESAKVCAIAGDDYFAKNKLEAWNIKYSLDNDAKRFAWADAVNGKGVIHYMCDENGNSAPYDFKNILFGENYTFELSGEDFSLNGIYCRNNEIRPYVAYGTQYLNNNLCNNLYEGECSNNFFDYNCHDNYLVDNCFNNSFGEGCYGNTLYYNCYNNVFGISCNNNILEDSCANNVFMSGCGNNTFGILCSDNYLSQACRGNEFKRGSSRNYLEPYCRYNTLGIGSSNNRFSSRCENNTLGDNAIGNTFGAGCQNNTLGKYCQYNSYGNYCINISFRSTPNINAIVVDYVQNCHISDGCSYIVIYTRPRATAILQNVRVKGGASGTSSEYQYITVLEYNAEDVCKGDEVADCSLAGEVTVTDHVRESDDGSRPLCRAKKAKQSYLSTNKEEKKWPARKSASSSGLTSTASSTRLPSASSRPPAAPAPRSPARSRFPLRRKL